MDVFDDSVNNFSITNSIYKDKNNNKFKNKLVKAFRNIATKDEM